MKGTPEGTEKTEEMSHTPTFQTVKNVIKKTFLKITISPLTSPTLGIVIGGSMMGSYYFLTQNYSNDKSLIILGGLLFFYSFITFSMAISRDLGVPLFLRKVVGFIAILLFLSGFFGFLFISDMQFSGLCVVLQGYLAIIFGYCITPFIAIRIYRWALELW